MPKISLLTHPLFVSVPCRPGHSAQTVSRRGPDGFLKGPPSLPDCGPFARPLGPSEKIDEANWTDQAEIAGVTNGCGRISCQAFSKDLIVRTICGSSPLVRLPTPKLCGRAFPGNFQWGGNTKKGGTLEELQDGLLPHVARMVLQYFAAQVGGFEVGVDLGGAYALMAEHGLNGPQVGTALE